MRSAHWPPLPGTEEALAMWTIYEKPLDFPGSWVVRRCFVGKDLPLPELDPSAPGVFFDVVPRLASSLAEARSFVPHGLYRQPRQEGDDPFIVETWF